MTDVAYIADVPAAPSVTPGRVDVAPYAIVRLAALVTSADREASARLRATMAAAVAAHLRLAEIRPDLEELLHDAATASNDRRALIEIRRDVHNLRSSRTALRAALTDFVPLTDWFRTHDELAQLDRDLADAVGPALDDDRLDLAEACRSEPLRRAVALTGEDLLRAVVRAAECGTAADKRARKSEPTVLRYALRAATKTSPLSWFTFAAWGRWGAETSGVDTVTTPATVATSRPDRGAVDALVTAALARAASPHVQLQLEPGVRVDGAHVLFRRAAAIGEYGAVIQREEELSLPMTPVLGLVLRSCAAGAITTRTELADGIAKRLPLDPAESSAVADRFVQDLVAQGLLRPVPVTDPQHPQAVRSAVALLEGVGAGTTADLLNRIDDASHGFADVPAAGRARAIAELTELWAEAFRSVDADPTVRRMPVTEDVAVPAVVTLGDDMGRSARDTVARLAPLFETFDLFAVVRRAARDRFVARYGEGASCDTIASFAVDYADAWRDVELVGPGGIAVATRSLGPGLDELADLRRRLTLIAAQAPVVDGTVELPDRVVTDARRLLPPWLAARPTSYSVFAQPDAERLCVNRIYGGWGRFTSRFLAGFGADAAAEVATQIHDVLGHGLVAQIRPVGGFNANLHPLLVRDEVAEHGTSAVIHPASLQLVHDRVSDQLRLRHKESGRFVDLLYLGFLVPVALPERLVPLLNDLGSGLVDVVAPLRPVTVRETRIGSVQFRPRLTYRDVVLGRRQWRLDADIVQRWRAELAGDLDAAMTSVVRRRADLGLPAGVFVAGAAGGQGADLTALQDYVDAPKPQYVDLGSALHVRCLARTLARYPRGVILEEALPAPEPGRRCIEIMLETYRRTA